MCHNEKISIKTSESCNDRGTREEQTRIVSSSTHTEHIIARVGNA